MRRLLMIFAKLPEHGKVKTRLAETIGEDLALKVYLKLLQHTHEVASKADCDKLIFYTGEPTSFDLLDYYRIPKTTQSEGDLGERMKDGFKRAFAQGYDQVLIIGSDCFELETEHIDGAFTALDSHDFVIGPASDGGYYLLGMNSFTEELFDNKEWSSADVFLDTVLDLKKREASYHILSTLNDVDREEDLPTELKQLLEKQDS